MLLYGLVYIYLETIYQLLILCCDHSSAVRACVKCCTIQMSEIEAAGSTVVRATLRRDACSDGMFGLHFMDAKCTASGGGCGTIITWVSDEVAESHGLHAGLLLRSLTADGMEYDVEDVTARALVALLGRRQEITISCVPVQETGSTSSLKYENEAKGTAAYPLLTGGEIPPLAGLGMHGWAECTPVLELRPLLSAAEVAELHAAARALRSRQEPHIYDGPHESLFLHAATAEGEQYYKGACPVVRDKLVPLLRSHWPSGEQLGVRCVEYHTYRAGGCLLDADHIDAHSLMTLSVLLSDPEADHDGGEFMTFQGGVPRLHRLGKGEGVLFQSERVHNVAAVLTGTRHSLVIEMWEGGDNRTDRHT